MDIRRRTLTPGFMRFPEADFAPGMPQAKNVLVDFVNFF